MRIRQYFIFTHSFVTRDDNMRGTHNFFVDTVISGIHTYSAIDIYL